jgi:hypothetical protein
MVRPPGLTPLVASIWDSRIASELMRGVGFVHQCEQVTAENEHSCLNIVRVCTG